MKLREPRIYEYVADDGTVYWSFTRHEQTISAPKRLVLQNRLGTMLFRFLVYLRKQSVVWDSTETEDGVR